MVIIRGSLRFVNTLFSAPAKKVFKAGTACAERRFCHFLKNLTCFLQNVLDKSTAQVYNNQKARGREPKKFDLRKRGGTRCVSVDLTPRAALSPADGGCGLVRKDRV